MAENKQIEKVKQAVNNTQITTVFDYFQKRRSDIERVLPHHITPDRLIGIMTYAIRSNPEIMKASQLSLIAAVIQTVQIGLEPTSTLGHCYYVPFNNRKKDGSIVKEVQFIIGFKGMVELVNRAGKSAIIATEVVREGDEFEFEQGLNPILRHIPKGDNTGKILGVYCIAKNLVADEKVFVYLNKEEIDKVRRASKAGDSSYSPWNTWYEEMAKKTAIKRICKLLPLSVEVQRNISVDETVKTRFEKDMTSLPDETNWQNGEVVETKSIEKAPPPLVDTATEEINAYKQMLDKAQKVKKEVGDTAYYSILKRMGRAHSNEIKSIDEFIVFFDECEIVKKAKESKNDQTSAERGS